MLNINIFSAQSNQINKTRLKVLQFRDERLIEIIEEARNSLSSLKQDSSQYSQLLFNYSLEVFYRLMENEVVLECIPEDLELVEAASKKAAQIFKESTLIDLNVKVVGNLSEQ